MPKPPFRRVLMISSRSGGQMNRSRRKNEPAKPADADFDWDNASDAEIEAEERRLGL